MGVTKEGVKKALALVRRMDKHTAEIAELEVHIHESHLTLNFVKENLVGVKTELNSLLANLDLTAVGNWGHEDRRNWFLVELLRQTQSVSAETRAL